MAATNPEHSDVGFGEPHPYGYVYVGARVTPPEHGPIVRSDRERGDVLAKFRELSIRIEALSEVVATTLYEAVLMPPLPGTPRYDVVLLITTTSPESIDAVLASDSYHALGGELVMVARNTHRIGETEDGIPATFLFNHFTAPDHGRAVVMWEELARWYVTRLGVDNSTLLQPLGEAPFTLVNYVRLPGGPVRFLLSQFSKPSFFGKVRRGLRSVGMTARPVFYRRV